MPKLRTVETWPSTRFPERPWHDDPDLAAFLGSSRGVFDLYSDELPAAKQTARSSTVRFMLVEDAKSQDGFTVVLFRQPFEGFDMVRLTVPEGFAALSADDQARVALDVIHATVCALGDLRGWQQDRLADVRTRAVERGLRFTWATAWKTSPGRRHQGRAVYWLDGDGNGNVQLELRPYGQDAVTARSEPALAFMTAEGFKRSAATLHWIDAATVAVVPYAGLFGDDRGHLRLEATATLAPSHLPAPLMPTTDGTIVATEVITGDEWKDDPDTEWIALESSFEGAYGDEMLRVTRLLAEDVGFAAWWAESPFRLLRVRSVELDPNWPDYAPKPGTRKSGKDLVLTIVAAQGDLPPRRDKSGRKDRARSDLHAALVELANARGLPSPPRLPDSIRSS